MRVSTCFDLIHSFRSYMDYTSYLKNLLLFNFPFVHTLREPSAPAKSIAGHTSLIFSTTSIIIVDVPTLVSWDDEPCRNQISFDIMKILGTRAFDLLDAQRRIYFSTRSVNLKMQVMRIIVLPNKFSFNGILIIPSAIHVKWLIDISTIIKGPAVTPKTMEINSLLQHSSCASSLANGTCMTNDPMVQNAL